MDFLFSRLRLGSLLMHIWLLDIKKYFLDQKGSNCKSRRLNSGQGNLKYEWRLVSNIMNRSTTSGKAIMLKLVHGL